MQKVGMTYEGRLRANSLMRGKWHDSLQYSILETEWGKTTA
jgi:[ribosomal protein S5]-alanine N-acetyltransferase